MKNGACRFVNTSHKLGKGVNLLMWQSNLELSKEAMNQPFFSTYVQRSL